MTDVAAVTEDAFCAAFTHGALPVIAAFLSRSSVRSRVLETDAFIASQTLERDVFDSRLTDAWFLHTTRHELLPATAVRQGHVHVVEWLYSLADELPIRATLVLLLPRVIRTAIECDALALVELLLESPAFVMHMQSQEKQALLSTELSWINDQCAFERAIHLLLAHGATITPRVLQYHAEMGSPRQLCVMAEQGACFVGSEVIADALYAANVETARWLRMHGADLGNTSGRAMFTAVEDVELTEWMLREAFGDADVRDDEGRTPLMMIGGVRDDEAQEQLGRVLIEYGADVHAVDASGHGILYYLERGQSSGPRQLYSTLLAFAGEPASSDITSTQCQVQRLVTRELFQEAVTVGDPLIRAYFAQDAVLADVLALDAAIATSSSPTALYEDSATNRWTSGRRQYPLLLWPEVSAMNDHVDAVEWLFTSSDLGYRVHATISQLIRQVLERAMRSNNIKILELVLASGLFATTATHEQKIRTFDHVLCLIDETQSQTSLTHSSRMEQ